MYHQPKFKFRPSYDEIHIAITDFCESYVSVLHKWNFTHIVPIIRGGMIPATIMAHRLGLPVFPVSYSSTKGRGDDQNHSNLIPDIVPAARLLLVDDICDTGYTIEELARGFNLKDYVVASYCLYQKASATFHATFHTWTVEPYESDTWVVFPWEEKIV